MRIVEVAFYLALTVLFILPSYALVTGQGAAVVLASVFPGAMAVFLLKMREFVEFSAGPFRAKLRDTIAEAESIRDEMRRLAVALSKVQVTAIAASLHSVYEGSMRIDDGYRLYDEIICSLRRLNVAERDVLEVRDIYNREALSKYCQIVAQVAGRDLADASSRQSLSSAMERIRRDARHRPVLAPSKDEILAVLSQFEVTPTGIVGECLSDYLHLKETGDMRSPERFTSGYRANVD